ncbi:MAG TPA: hypothetical protein VF284_12665 [Rhodanobacteraceae bacterium]
MSLRSRRFRSSVDLNKVLARIKQAGPSTLLTTLEATALVAGLTKDQHDTTRTARNRVRMQLRRALTASAHMREPPEDGTCLVADPRGRVRVDELTRWAALKHGIDRFEGLPRKGRVLTVRIEETLVMSGSAECVVIPASPQDRAEAVRRLAAELREEKERHAATTRELEACKAELERRDRIAARLRPRE